MKRNKYGAKKTVVDGIKFDSKRESERYKELKLLSSAGEIADLSLQERFDFVINGVKLGFYKADFSYWDVSNHRSVVEDVKGFKTPVYNLKKKLMKAIHGIDILET